MCAIVDTNCIPLVFNPSAKEHARFAPVLAWLKSSNGRIIYGGKKYKTELRKMTTFLRIFKDYEAQGKIVFLNDAQVDAFAARAKQKVRSSKFNDEHLVGIAAISRCRVICTDDKEAVPFLTRADLYTDAHPMKPPKIYTQNSHKHLCCKKNIVAVCR